MLEVWPENWEAWEVFQSCHSQWRVAPMGGLLGLDYPAVEIVMRAYGLQIQKLPDIQRIEMGALIEFSENRKE